MTDINVTFCRELLKGVHAEVRPLFPTVDLREDVGICGPTGVGTNKQYLFEAMIHGQRFADYVTADNAYEARAKGWNRCQNACGGIFGRFAQELAQ